MLAGRFRLDEPLGEHPTRWLAHDGEQDRLVVVTRVETGATGSASEEIAGRAGRSVTGVVRALADAGTPTVLAPTEALLDTGELWVVRGNVDAIPLTEHQFDERGLARIGSDVAGALVAAHSAGVVHGDVRAESILVRADGSAALAGFATTAPRDLAPSAPDPAHPEPERVKGHPAGPAADVHALGVVLGAALDRAGITPSDRLGGFLRTMRAEAADVRPTAWAAQQRLGAVALADPPEPVTAATPADPTRVTADAGNATTAVVTLEKEPATAATPRTAAVGVGAAAVGRTAGGGSDPRGNSPAGQWSGGPTGAAWGGSGGYGSPAGGAPGAMGRHGVPPGGGYGTPPGSHAPSGYPGAGGTPPGGHSGQPAPAGAPRPSNTKRWLGSAAGVLAVAALIAGAVVIVAPVAVVTGTAAAPPGTAPPPPSLLGEVRTADPCTLIDPAVLGTIGKAQVLSGFGDAASCSVGVTREADYGYVQATITKKTLAPPFGVPAKNGDLTIHRSAENQRTCDRTIVLPDEYRVVIFAGTGTNDTTFPVCTLADTATDAAVAVLNERRVGRRDLDIPRTSLLTLRACDIIDPAALSSVPSLRSLRERGYNDWSCGYGSDPSFPTGAQVFVTFTRYSNLGGGDPIFTLDGRSAATFPSRTGSLSCEIAVAQRSFVSPAGNQRLEVLSIRVRLAKDQPGASPTAACLKATDLARSAIPKLPPTQ